MNPMKTTLIALAVLSAFSLSLPVHAAKTPRPLITDQRMKKLTYDPNQVYDFIGTPGYYTTIEFGPDETVKVIAAGDTIAWQIVPDKNAVMLKPTEKNAATNLTVRTAVGTRQTERRYYFEITSSDNQALRTVRVRFEYPSASPITTIAGPAAAVPKPVETIIGCDRANVNRDYGTSGDKTVIALQRACDDGKFTYLQFDPDAEIPSIHLVGADGTESTVNTRREGRYLVVERTGSMFILKNGPSAHLCVQNNANPYKRAFGVRKEA